MYRNQIQVFSHPGTLMPRRRGMT